MKVNKNLLDFLHKTDEIKGQKIYRFDWQTYLEQQGGRDFKDWEVA